MREGRGRLFLIIYSLLIFSFSSRAQEIKVNGGFIEDSLLIGQNINYWITASYPAQMEMVFPDSNYTFKPFEYSDKAYFPTILKEGLAFDSTVYTLQSFEIDPIQYLQLQAVILHQGDSIKFNTPSDSIYLKELAPMVSDTTQLKTNLEYQSVNRQFNYPLLYYIIGAFIIASVVLLLIFGKRIIRYFKLKKLLKEHQRFSTRLNEYINQLKSDPNQIVAEQALTIWKKYQQRLDKIDFNTLTTKEILALAFTGELKEPLKSIDRTVYGNRIQENIYQDFQQLENFSEDRYQKKVEEIKNGK